jgi:hypothetical protein
MSRVKTATREWVGHGAPITHGIALAYEGGYSGEECDVLTWAARADVPHKCDVDGCRLYRRYLRARLRYLFEKSLLITQSRAALRRRLPDELVDKILSYAAGLCAFSVETPLEIKGDFFLT